MRKVKIAVSFILLFAALSLGAYAAESDSAYDSQLEASGAQGIYDGLDSEIKDGLDELGVSGADFSSLYDLSPKKIFSFISDAASGSLEQPSESLVKLLSVIIVISIGSCFMPDDERMKSIMNMTAALLCISAVIVPLFRSAEAAVSSIGTSCVFIKTLIPVLAGVISASGKPSLALSFQSWGFTAAQVISALSESYIMPAVGAVLALDITGSLMPSFKLSGITELIKKTVTAVMSFTATMYVSFLGLKGALANSADSLATKGIKLVISSAIPVVGGAVSEAYSGIIGSLVLVKSTVGIFGIIVISIITLPSVVQLLFCIFALKIGAAASELFNLDGVSQLLKSLSSAVTLLNVVLIFNSVLFIISLALIISMSR